MSCLPRFLLPPRVSCAVCGGQIRPGVPYPRSLVRHSMRSVRSAGSVRLPFWFSPHVHCVCVRSRSRGVRAAPPLPWLVWRAHLARSRCRALVGPFHAVRAPPRVLPRSRAPFGLFFWGGGGGPGPVSRLLGLGLCAPRVVGSRVWGVPAPGGGVGGGGGGGGGLCAVPPDCAAGGGQWGGGSPRLGPSLCLPWAANKAAVFGVALAMEGVAPIPLKFVLACCLRARSLWRPGVLARVRLSIVVPAGAGGWGVGAGPAPASLPGAAVLPRGGGIISSASGGVGGGAPVACGPVGGLGGQGGGGRAVPPLLPLGGGWPVALCPVPLSSPAHPPQVYALGRGRGAAPGAGCGLPPAGQRGGRGGGGAARQLPPRGAAGGFGGRGVVLPRSVPLPSLGGQLCGRH